MPEPETQAETRRPIFFRITIGLLVMLSLFGAGLVLLLALNATEINRSGGWGWIMGGAIFVVAMVLTCAGCAVSSALSIRRHEAHRTLSTVILIGSCLVVLTFGSNLVRAVINLYGQYHDASRAPQPSRQSERTGVPASEIPASLVQHFQRHGIVLSRAQPGTRNREWVVERTDVGARCEVVTSFRGFAHAAPVELITKNSRKHQHAVGAQRTSQNGDVLSARARKDGGCRGIASSGLRSPRRSPASSSKPSNRTGHSWRRDLIQAGLVRQDRAIMPDLLSRRALLVSLGTCGALFGRPLRSSLAAQASPTPIRVRTLNHFGIAVSDPRRSIDFYQATLRYARSGAHGHDDNPASGRWSTVPCHPPS